jgi:hypothetical protein
LLLSVFAGCGFGNGATPQVLLEDTVAHSLRPVVVPFVAPHFPGHRVLHRSFRAALRT